jgi:two-component system CheB/CheR fusion protein
MNIAASAGLISEIGLEVARISAEQIAKWDGIGINWPVAINIYPSQFAQPDFSRSILGYFKMLKLPANRIELEVTETAATADPAAAARHLEKLREAGIKIAIDDYGTGYSNMAQLFKLPFDTLKIDRSLISSIDLDERSEFIIASTISMTRSLGHNVVAEGVETAEQLEFLKKCGCDMIQGYFFTRPMDGDALVEWDENRRKVHKEPA